MKPVQKKPEQGKEKKKENGNKTPNTKKKEIQYVRIFAIQQHYKETDFIKPMTDDIAQDEMEKVELIANGEE